MRIQEKASWGHRANILRELSTDGYFASSTGMNQRPFAPGLENTHLTRNVRPRLSTADSDIRASTTIDGTSTPVSRIFYRLRNISTNSLQNPDEVSENVTLQPPFRTVAGSPNGKHFRAAIVYANVSSAPSSDGHHLDTDVFRNRRMTDDSQPMPLLQITVETTIPVQLEYADASSNTCKQVVSTPINRNSLWQHVKNCETSGYKLTTQTSETSDLTVGHQHFASKPVLNEVSAANESVATNTRKWKKSQPLRIQPVELLSAQQIAPRSAAKRRRQITPKLLLPNDLCHHDIKRYVQFQRPSSLSHTMRNIRQTNDRAMLLCLLCLLCERKTKCLILAIDQTLFLFGSQSHPFLMLEKCGIASWAPFLDNGGSWDGEGTVKPRINIITAMMTNIAVMIPQHMVHFWKPFCCFFSSMDNSSSTVIGKGWVAVLGARGFS
nr:hypothetical protein [Tanacetum cinerariifolium]